MNYKKFIISTLFSTIILLNVSFSANQLESNLREIRDNLRHYPEEGKNKIEKLWKNFPEVNNRLWIFLDLSNYYRKNFLHELLIEQGTWLIKENIPSLPRKMWVYNLIADSLSELGKIDEAIEHYEEEFKLGCKLRGKNPKEISRSDFIKHGVGESSLWGDWVIRCSLTYAKANRFSDAYSILNFAKVLTPSEGIKAERMDYTYTYQKTRIRIIGLMEGKLDKATEELKNINKGRPFLDNIEPGATSTWEEELCIKAKDYKLLVTIYLNTLVENPPVGLFTYRRIIYNARDNVYILSKLLTSFDNSDFCNMFERELKERLKKNNLAHLNLLLAEYYFNRKDYSQANQYCQLTIQNKTSNKYYFPKYYPNLNLNENYQSPHRPHLWVTCYEQAKDKLDQLKK